MENAVSVQTLEFLYSALLGIAAGVFYDLLRVIRTYTSEKRWITGIFDAFFWIVASFSLFAFILTYSGGHMRWYILVGVFCGGFVYRTAASEIVFRLTKSTSDLLIKLLSLSTRPLYRFLSGAKGYGRNVKKKAVSAIRKRKLTKKGKDSGNGSKKKKEKKHSA